MKIEKHADNSEKLFGYRAEDIHKWIDHYFDHDMFRQPVVLWFLKRWNPYGHRRHLHHKEALPQALEKFREKYPEEIIEKVFLQHLKDDYNGYIPSVDDFDDLSFKRKYHRFL